MTAERPSAQPLPVRDPASLEQARLAVLESARRELCIRLPRLRPGLLDAGAAWEALRRVALAGRGARIRVLLLDPEAALREGHRLVSLVQRLSSIVKVRVPLEDSDRADSSALLLNDAGGYLLQADAERPLARAALYDGPGHAPLRQQFEQAWERAERAGILQALDL